MYNSVRKTEKTIKQVEGITVKVSRPFEYNYERAAPGRFSIGQWKRHRIPPGVVVVVLDQDGSRVHGRTLLRNLRYC